MRYIISILATAALALTACTGNGGSGDGNATRDIPVDTTTPDVATVADLVHDRPVLIDFYATWCGPCKQQSPIIDRLEAKYPQVEFRRIDVDRNEQLARSADVSAIPTIMLVTPDGVARIFVGLQSYDTLDAALAQLIK